MIQTGKHLQDTNKFSLSTYDTATQADQSSNQDWQKRRIENKNTQRVSQPWKQLMAAVLVFLVFYSGLFASLYSFKSSIVEKQCQVAVGPVANVKAKAGSSRIVKPVANTKTQKFSKKKHNRAFPVSRGQLLNDRVNLASGVAVALEPETVADKVYPAEHKQNQKGIEGQSIVVVSTAYTYTGNNTATGVPPRRGLIAVDPRVIPLGTRMYVEGYGEAVAADTGGAIKGRKIDLFMESRKEAIDWGRRKVIVHILK